jgi:hypothetical protein
VRTYRQIRDELKGDSAELTQWHIRDLETNGVLRRREAQLIARLARELDASRDMAQTARLVDDVYADLARDQTNPVALAIVSIARDSIRTAAVEGDDETAKWAKEDLLGAVAGAGLGWNISKNVWVTVGSAVGGAVLYSVL